MKPLTRREIQAKSGLEAFRALRRPVAQQPLWFRRFLVVGSGALVMIAFVLVSAILVGINDPVVGPEVATNVETLGPLAQPIELFNLDFSPSPAFEPLADEVGIVRSNIRGRFARPGIHVTANKPVRRLRRLPQPMQPKFTPTTLVIYAENGVIYTRIEPWLQAVNRKTPTSNN
ncbi:MAG TPA: hypothetical protein VFZ23_14500 [Pyrinomonadaceae bacterium]